jgi:hypothetical protein
MTQLFRGKKIVSRLRCKDKKRNLIDSPQNFLSGFTVIFLPITSPFNQIVVFATETGKVYRKHPSVATVLFSVQTLIFLHVSAQQFYRRA